MVKVRRAEERDIPRILELLVQVNMVHHNGRPDLFNGPATKYTEAELRELLKDESRPVFVGVGEDDVPKGHGFCIFQQHIGDNILTDVKTLYIDDICVDENCRRQGVAESIYKAILDYAAETDCYNVTLNVWALNPGAQRFYEKMGMVPQKIGMETIL